MPEFYSHYGLRLWSEIELPELPKAEAGSFDVDIRLVDQLPDVGTRFVIEELASFTVQAGHSIFVQPEAAASSANLRLFLLGTAMGLLLHQRGDLPLHANSLFADGKGAIVMGASGSGKSSLAAWMQRHDVTPLSDDVCVIRTPSGGAPQIYPGVPRMRLWEDAVLREGRDPRGLAPVYEGDPDYRKFYLPIDLERRAHAAVELACAYVLEKGPQFMIEQISGAELVDAYFAHTYRGEYVQSEGSPPRHWEACIRLASDIPTFRVVRTMQLETLEEENLQILSHLRASVSSTSHV